MVQRYDELVAGLRTQVILQPAMENDELHLKLDSLRSLDIFHHYQQVNAGIQERTKLRKELWNNNKLLHATGGAISETRNIGKKSKKQVRGQTNATNQK